MYRMELVRRCLACSLISRQGVSATDRATGLASAKIGVCAHRRDTPNLKTFQKGTGLPKLIWSCVKFNFEINVNEESRLESDVHHPA